MYRLAKESDIAYSNLNNMMNRNTQPSIPTLRKICNGLGITLSEFFDETGNPSELEYKTALSQKENSIIDCYRHLSPRDQELFQAYLLGLSKKESL